MMNSIIYNLFMSKVGQNPLFTAVLLSFFFFFLGLFYTSFGSFLWLCTRLPGAPIIQLYSAYRLHAPPVMWLESYLSSSDRQCRADPCEACTANGEIHPVPAHGLKRGGLCISHPRHENGSVRLSCRLHGGLY